MPTFKKYLSKTQTVVNEELLTFVGATAAQFVLFYLINKVLGDEEEKYDREKVSLEDIKTIEREIPQLVKAIDDDELTKKYNQEMAALKAKKIELEKAESELTAKYDRDKKAEFFAKNRLKDFPSAEDLANTSNTSTASNSYRAQNPPQSAFKK